MLRETMSPDVLYDFEAFYGSNPSSGILGRWYWIIFWYSLIFLIDLRHKQCFFYKVAFRMWWCAKNLKCLYYLNFHLKWSYYTIFFNSKWFFINNCIYFTTIFVLECQKLLSYANLAILKNISKNSEKIIGLGKKFKITCSAPSQCRWQFSFFPSISIFE